MANKKITELTELSATPADGDLLPIVDISDTTDSVNGTTKKITYDTMIPDASATVYGKTKLSTAPASASEPIAVGDNDTRVPTQGENDALVGTSGTPSSSNKYVTDTDTRLGKIVFSATVGEAIDGSTTPVPVFIGHNEYDVYFAASGTGTDLQFHSGSNLKVAIPITGGGQIIDSVKASLKKSGTPSGTITAYIFSDSSSSPGTQLYTIGTFSSSSLTTGYQDTVFYNNTTKYTLTNSTTYWIVLDGTASTGDCYYQYSNSGTDRVKIWNGSSWVEADGSCTNNFSLGLYEVGGRIYKSDANNTYRDEFKGFVTENVADAGTATIQNKGVCSGFTGLTAGAQYYVSDTIGTIATSGTGSISVGQALSTTEILLP